MEVKKKMHEYAFKVAASGSLRGDKNEFEKFVLSGALQ